MNELMIDKTVKIKNVKKIWKKIEKQPLPVELNFKDFENFDCAGFQLFLNLLKLEQEYPENYKITGLNNELIESLPMYGYKVEKGDDKK